THLRRDGGLQGMSRKPIVIDGMPAPGMSERAIKGVVLTVVCALVIFPFIGIISTSLASPEQVVREGGFVFFPTSIDLTAYRSILVGGVVTRALGVSDNATDEDGPV